MFRFDWDVTPTLPSSDGTPSRDGCASFSLPVITLQMFSAIMENKIWGRTRTRCCHGLLPESIPPPAQTLSSTRGLAGRRQLRRRIVRNVPPPFSHASPAEVSRFSGDRSLRVPHISRKKHPVRRLAHPQSARNRLQRPSDLCGANNRAPCLPHFRRTWARSPQTPVGN